MINRNASAANCPLPVTQRKIGTPAKPAASQQTRVFLICAFIALLTASGPVRAASGAWPQWRGPQATGESVDAEPPLTWSETDHIKWKVPIAGAGTATPIVWEGKVFLLTAVPNESKADPKAPEPTPPGGGRPGGSTAPAAPFRFLVLCLDRASGKTLWEKCVAETQPHEGHHRDHGFASASPVTDGKLLIASFGSRGVHAVDFSGNIVWSKDLGRMQTRNAFGEGSSPALHGDTVVVLWDHEGDDFIVALDRQNGREKWRTPREESTTWTTPLVVEHEGKAAVVVPATSRTRCYDLATGRQVWEAPGLTANVIPSAVAASGVVYVTSGFRGSALRAIKLGGAGDLSSSPFILWSQDRNTPYVPSPLLAGGSIYLLSGNNGLLSCVDAKSGQAHYSAERLPGVQNVYASPVAGRDRVYVLSREGVCLVIKQGPRLEVLATNKIDEPTDASIALAGRDLFIRGRQNLYCIAER